MGRRAYLNQPTLPAFLLEEPYDEVGPDGNNYNPNATQPVRRFIWWGWLTTIGGYVAGNGFVWPFIEPLWQQHLNTAGTKDLERLNTFIQSLNWWDLVPAGLDGSPSFIVEPNQVDTSSHFIATAYAKNGSLLDAYLPPDLNQNITLDLSSMAKNCRGYWYDPSKGNYLPIRHFKRRKNATVMLSPPGWNNSGYRDWVLLIMNSKIPSYPSAR